MNMKLEEKPHSMPGYSMKMDEISQEKDIALLRTCVQ